MTSLSHISEADLVSRRAVWEALSKLFLDTDTTLFEDEIVEKLARSPYVIGELEEIFTHEVTPVCMWNMFWWEWAGFDPEWLEEAILKKRRSPSRFFYRALAPYVKLKLRRSSQWHRIAKRIVEKRASTCG